MMQIFAGILFSLILAIPMFAQTTHHVRAGATGTADGTDWTNAFTNLPATLVRGDTYYIADGTYGAYVFNDANSATTKIFIKKAIESDHGSATGWLSSYGDGAAEWTDWDITTDYWELDGQVGQWATTYYGVPSIPGYVAYGFEVHKTATTESDFLVRMGNWNDIKTDITIRHTRIYYTNTPLTPGNWVKKLDTIYGGVTPLRLEFLWVHDAGRNSMYMRSNDAIIENSVFERNRQAQAAENFSPFEHGQICDCGGTQTWRYNYIRDWVGIGGILAEAGSGFDFKVHGNVFNQNGYFPDSTTSDGHGPVGATCDASNVTYRVYNNTFADITYGGTLLQVASSCTSSPYALRDTRNNIFYNVKRKTRELLIEGTHDYNWFFNSGTQSETNIQNGAGDPFVNLAGFDFHLAAATNAGDTNIGSTFQTDPDGVTRGADGVWDRGGFEFDTAPPSPLDIITTSLSNSTVGAAYNETIETVGGVAPVSCSLFSGALPAGVTRTGCVLSGTPTTAETANFTIRATDSDTPTPATDNQAYAVTISTVTITTNSPLPDGNETVPYSTVLAATGGVTPYVWSCCQAGALPAGLTLNATGTLSGTPTTAATSNFTVRVTDDNSITADKAFALTINEQTGGLVTRGLVVDYPFDEAASGTAPTEAFDLVGNGHATITYDASNLFYTEVGGNRGLESASLTGLQKVTLDLDEAGGATVGSALDQQKTITLELVLRVDAVQTSPNVSRVWGIRDAANLERFGIEVDEAATPDIYALNFNGTTRADWPVAFGTRDHWCVAIDSTKAAAADRVKVYQNGVEITVTVRNGGIPIDEALTIQAGFSLVGLNWLDAAGSRSFDGVLFRARISNAAYTASECLNNARALLNDDDSTAFIRKAFGLRIAP